MIFWTLNSSYLADSSASSCSTVQMHAFMCVLENSRWEQFLVHRGGRMLSCFHKQIQSMTQSMSLTHTEKRLSLDMKGSWVIFSGTSSYAEQNSSGTAMSLLFCKITHVPTFLSQLSPIQSAHVHCCLKSDDIRGFWTELCWSQMFHSDKGYIFPSVPLLECVYIHINLEILKRKWEQ